MGKRLFLPIFWAAGASVVACGAARETSSQTLEALRLENGDDSGYRRRDPGGMPVIQARRSEIRARKREARHA